MNAPRIILPKSIPDLMNPARMHDLGRAYSILNAFAGLRLQINRSDGSSAGNTAMQISEGAALLSVTASFLAPIVARVLLVGGGASGGGASTAAGTSGGGGGAGRYVPIESWYPISGTYSVTIGAGGTAVTNLPGIDGGDTTLVGAGISKTAPGGGGGGVNGAGRNGGSGGGGAGFSTTNAGGVAVGTGGQGKNGGAGKTGATNDGAGGGGGAGGAGSDGVGNANGGPGGSGIYNDISGVSTPYAGGGGGGFTGATVAPGGSFIGGAGASGSGSPAGPGVANRGSGGGGGANGVNGGFSGPGSDGVVIISYPGEQRATGGTVTSVGGRTIHTFTASGSFVVT